MRYYVRTIAQSVSGDRGVHESTCSRLPNPENRLYLGDFPSCSPAVRKAKQTYLDSNGCYFCSNPCHTT